MEDEEEGTLVWFNNKGHKIWKDKRGRVHRLNGPAIEYEGGDSSWFRHGILHRDDGPAREWSNSGAEEWYKDGYEYEPSAHELIAWKMKKGL
jgi:hypothetical protein